MRAILPLFLILSVIFCFSVPFSALAKTQSIYDPSTGSTLYIHEDKRGNVDIYDPSTGQTTYLQNN